MPSASPSNVLFGLAAVLLTVPALAKLPAVAALPSGLMPSADLETALIRAGLDADALAATCATPAQTTTVVDDFEAAMALEPTRLADADADYSEARVTTNTLRRKVQSGKATQAEIDSYNQAVADLDAAEAERDATLDDWFGAGSAGLNAGQIATLQTIRGNRDWELDIELLTLDRTESEWAQLRDALSHEKTCQKYGEALDPSVASFLASCRGATEVASAKTCLDTNLATIETAWSTAVND